MHTKKVLKDVLIMVDAKYSYQEFKMNL